MGGYTTADTVVWSVKVGHEIMKLKFLN